MSEAQILTESTFATTIASATPTLVDFWAPWCGPCKMMLPIVGELATEVTGKATVAKVNVDDEGALAAKYNITSIPCFIVFKNGQEVTRLIGAQRKDSLKSALGL